MSITFDPLIPRDQFFFLSLAKHCSYGKNQLELRDILRTFYFFLFVRGNQIIAQNQDLLSLSYINT